MVSSYAVDKSGVTPNTVSLPEGPGSIEGLGESFEPSLNDGTAKYAVPISVPPGTAGHAPGIALRYDSGKGNGPLGFGWSLDVPYIQRQTDKGIPRYVDGPNGVDDDLDGTPDNVEEIDIFINGMKEELVPCSNGYYFCENEGAFIRYERVADHWEARTPTGTRLIFGSNADSRITRHLTPDTFRWLLASSIDPNGNTIEFTYTAFPGPENTNQVYLSQIRYGPGAPPWANYHFVVFHYGPRSDWFEDGRAGFMVRTGMRLTNIVVGTHGPELSAYGHLQSDLDGDGQIDNLNRAYRLSYKLNTEDGTLNTSPWSFLTSITPVGCDNTSTLPPVAFDYGPCDPPDTISASGRIIEGLNEPAQVMDNDLVDLVDLNGDALPDILKTDRYGGAHQCRLNLGPTNDGQAILWSPAAEVSTTDGLAWSVNLEDPDVVAHLADIDGDGRSDLWYQSLAGTPYYFENLGDNRWGPRMLLSVQDYQPATPFGDANVRTADIDFDKRIDIIQAITVGESAHYRMWYSLGDQRYSKRHTVAPDHGWLFSLEGVDIVDFNGDRVPDITRIRPMSVEAKAGLGYGQFCDTVTVAIPDRVLTDEQVARAKLRDVNGDGLVDLVLERAMPGVLWYWVNQGNYTFSSRKDITGMPTGLAKDPSIRWADINGNGTTDLLYCDSTTFPRIQAVDIGDLIGCTANRNLLTLIDNGIGRTTRIHYDMSTTYMLEDWRSLQQIERGVVEQKAAKDVKGEVWDGEEHPLLRSSRPSVQNTSGTSSVRAWPDPLPFPVKVVAMVTTEDGLGHTYTNEYGYHDGYYDPEEREFRGFARAEGISPGDASAPTLVTRSWFDTGRDYEAMKGKLLRVCAEQEDGQVFTDASTGWTDPPVLLQAGTDGCEVRFAHAVTSSNRVIELGQGTERLLLSETDYDAFGNQTRQVDYGVADPAFDDERITVTEFAVNTNDWLVRFPMQQEVMDEHGNALSRVQSFYDDPTFSGANLGTVTTGQLTMVRSWYHAENPSGHVNSMRNKYDAYGNMTHVLDALASAPGGVLDLAGGHAREIVYDAEFLALPVAEVIHIGGGSEALRIGVAYDAGMGTVVSSANFSGHSTLYEHDVHGRLAAFVRPGDAPGYPSAVFDYALAQTFISGGFTGAVNYVETRALDKEPGTAGDRTNHYYISRAFVDGMGRALMAKSEAGTDGVTVSGAVTFNARGKPSRQFNPYYAANLDFEDITATGWQGSTNFTEMIYDATLRPLRTIHPDATFTKTEYEPLVTITYDENDAHPTSQYSDTPLLHHSDGLGRLIRVDEVTRLNDDGTPSAGLNTWSTFYQYDLNDNLTAITDSQDNEKFFSCDSLGRKTFMNDPDRGVMHWTHDDVGNLVEQKDAKAQRVVYGYDGVNRLVSEDYLDEGLPFSANRTPDVEYYYDAPVVGLDMGRGITGTAENTKGHLSYVVDLSGEEHTSYDARGRMAWEVKRIPNSDTGVLQSFATHWSYDPMDRVTQIQYPDQDIFHYAYNARNALDRIHGDTSGDIISSVSYLPSGQVADRDYGNNVRTSYAYDHRLRLSSLNTEHRTLNTTLLHFAYTFDPASNITRIDDLRPGTEVPEGDPRRNTQIFGYDDLYRLTRARYSFNLPGQADRDDGVIAYRYDRLGNMLAKTSSIDHMENDLPITDIGEMDSGGVLGSWGRIGRAAGDPAGPHALSRIRHPSHDTRHYSYDANGNMLDIDGLHCTWDFLDRLVTVSNENMTAHYLYDYTGRRISKVVTETRHLNPETNSASYISRLYEIREGQPVKYVWDAATRVARLTETRTQEYDLVAGWNLCSIAVQSDSAAAQIGVGSPPIEHCFRWVGPTQDWERVESSGPLPAGSVFWLKATSNSTVSISGMAPALVGATTLTNIDFIPCPSLDSLSLDDLVPPSSDARMWDATEGRWRARFTASGITSESDIRADVQSGQAVSIGISTGAFLRIADPTLVMRISHQDHLGSSACLTDDAGDVAETSAFYPFGHLREDFRPREVDEFYGFTGKEEDSESTLHYFESRFYCSHLSRFTKPDDYVGINAMPIVGSPQEANLHTYCRNRPTRYVDPSGATGILPFYAAISEIWGSVTEGIGANKAYGVEDPVGFRNALRGLGGPSIGTSSDLATRQVSIGEPIDIDFDVRASTVRPKPKPQPLPEPKPPPPTPNPRPDPQRQIAPPSGLVDVALRLSDRREYWRDIMSSKGPKGVPKPIGLSWIEHVTAILTQGSRPGVGGPMEFGAKARRRIHKWKGLHNDYDRLLDELAGVLTASTVGKEHASELQQRAEGFFERASPHE